MARAPRAKYTIEAEDRTDRGLRSAEGRLRSFQRIIEIGLGNALANIGGAILKWGTAIVSASDRLDDLAKRAKDVGATLQEQQAIDLFAELQGAAPVQVGSAIERVQTAIGELAAGTKEVVEDFKVLGLSIDDLEGKTGLAQLLTVGAALEGAGPQQTAIRRRLVGRGTGRLFGGDFIGAAERSGVIGLERNLPQLARRAETLEDFQAEVVAVLKRGVEEAVLGGERGQVVVGAAEVLRDAIVSVFQGAGPERGGEFNLAQERVVRELQGVRRVLEQTRRQRVPGSFDD